MYLSYIFLNFQVVKSECNPDEYKLLVLNSPNNPSGLCFDAETLKGIALAIDMIDR